MTSYSGADGRAGMGSQTMDKKLKLSCRITHTRWQSLLLMAIGKMRACGDAGFCGC